MLRKPCRLQTDGRMDRRTDGQSESSNFVGRGYNDHDSIKCIRTHNPSIEPFEFSNGCAKKVKRMLDNIDSIRQLDLITSH